MMSIFKKPTINSQTQIQKIDEKMKGLTNDFSKRILQIEKFANTLYKKSNEFESKLNRFKTFCHNINILASDKDKDLKLIFANHTVCEQLYGLPNVCSELIENRFECDVINDYIEKTGKWNSFIESSRFNIDEIVKEELKERKFIQIGLIDERKLILETTIKPHLEYGEFNGVMTISNIIDQTKLDKINKNLIYDRNEYTVFEIN